MVKRGRSFSFVLLAAALAAGTAAAETGGICDDLRGRLANVAVTIGTRHETRQYSGAMEDQELQIRQLQQDMQGRGCGSGGAIIPDADDAAACDGMQASLERMTENLRYLTARRDGASRIDGSDDVLRDQLQRALRDHGCEAPSADADAETITNRAEEVPATPEQQAMRTDTFIPPMAAGQLSSEPPTYGGGGQLQTVCVRTCDGGFFPLTANATPLNFQQDSETCARMCPGIQTELYFRYLPDQESSEMVSAATGASYSAMPYAFAYRKRPPGQKSTCTCNLSAYYEEMRRERTLATPAPDTSPGVSHGSITTIESPKPAAAPPAAAETQPPKPPAERPYDPSSQKVRQVGPQFLANDDKIDLKHPKSAGPQPQQQ